MAQPNLKQAPELVYDAGLGKFSETCRVGELETEQHHELCLGVLARCYPHVPRDLQLAIENGIDWAAHLGFPVSKKNLAKGGPLFTGGNA